MRKRIFNSVGSNYNFTFVVKAFSTWGRKKHSIRLKEYLTARYGGETLLFYKGRQAIEYALRHANLPKDSKVIIPSFTCVVLPTAITYAGCIPVYADISRESLNYSAAELERVYDENVKAIIVQNSLGFPADIVALEEFCKKHSIIMIEDLAHNVGGTYLNEKSAGTVGDYVILSFSQDKMIDAVSGGALIIRTKKGGSMPTAWSKPSFFERLRDRSYPSLSWKIRFFYPIGIGKALHIFYQKIKFLPKPVISLDQRPPLALPGWYAALALKRFEMLSKDLERRRGLARKYLSELSGMLHSSVTESAITHATCLRIPLIIEDRDGLVMYLAKKGIYLSDIWYDVPVSPKRFWYLFEKTHSGVIGVETARTMFNLPTHTTLRDKDADRIIAAIKQWKSSSKK